MARSSNCQPGKRIAGIERECERDVAQGHGEEHGDKQASAERPHALVDLRADIRRDGPRHRLSRESCGTDLLYDPLDRGGGREHDQGLLRRVVDARLYPVECVQLSFDTGRTGTARHTADREGHPGLGGRRGVD